MLPRPAAVPPTTGGPAPRRAGPPDVARGNHGLSPAGTAALRIASDLAAPPAVRSGAAHAEVASATGGRARRQSGRPR